MTPQAHRIWGGLGDKEWLPDNLSEKYNMPINDVIVALFDMEVIGIIERTPEGTYRKKVIEKANLTKPLTTEQLRHENKILKKIARLVYEEMDFSLSTTVGFSPDRAGYSTFCASFNFEMLFDLFKELVEYEHSITELKRLKVKPPALDQYERICRKENSSNFFDYY